MNGVGLMPPVIVIGAGPQGLAAAAHLVDRGIETVVLEAGDGPASAVAAWGHVRLFSPWSELTDEASRRLLEPTGWTAPTTGIPTGAEWIDAYLAPLAATLGDRVHYNARVTGVGRKGRDLLVDDRPDAGRHVTTTPGDSGYGVMTSTSTGSPSSASVRGM